MLFRTFSSRIAGLLAVTLLATTAWAGPAIDSWDLQKTENQERIRVRWNEPAPVEIEEFPAARQVVVRIPGARLATADVPALDLENSSLLRRARIQPIALSDGRDGVQITLTMTEWRQLSTVATPRWLSISFAGQTTPGAPRLLLSNEDIEAFAGETYGSQRAPATGAGAANEPGAEPFASFWVPPDLTETERARAAGADIGLLQTNELMDRFVDLDFKDAELQNLIRSIARKLNLNIIMTPGQVRGRVTVSLANVRLGDALDAILKANDLSYKIDPGGIVRIVPRSEVRGSDKELVMRSIAINWVDAGEVARIIKPFLSGDGQVEYSLESNQLIVKDVPEVVGEIQGLVAGLDVPEKQVRMEVRLVDMTENAGRSLGFRSNWTNQSTEVVRTATGANGAVGDPITVVENLATIGQVPTAATALDVIHHEDLSIFGESFRIRAQLKAHEDRGEAVTLANPIILSLNNQMAEIDINRKIPYQDAVNSTQGSVATVKFQDVGTRVELTPRITNNGFVTMQIATEQKIDKGRANLPNSGEIPIVDERYATTSVTVKDEQTIALGGLRQFEAVTSESGVPWFMRMPVLGWLFKSQQNNMNKLEMYLFVTPHIVKDPEPSVFEMGLYEKIDYNWDLPDFYFDEMRARKGPAELNDPRVKGRQ